MDEGLLNDLLECSVCLERLDTSSRVLPCQHTFCLKCIKVIVESHKELRCPECRVLVDTKVEELPPNVLLMRILEGMRNSAPRKVAGSQRPVRTGHSQANKLQQVQSREGKQLPPHARAMYDYISKEPGDLSFKKGETIILQKKLDPYWYHGECSGRNGIFPITYVQVIIPLQVPTALCKAMYDFRMSAPDEEGCLAFDKGTIITVHRRVDENWAEGRVEQRVGIFPIAFVELNQAARHLMNSAPLNRAVPPVPEHARAGHSEHRHHAQHRFLPMTSSMPVAQTTYHNMATMSQSHPTFQQFIPQLGVGKPIDIGPTVGTGGGVMVQSRVDYDRIRGAKFEYNPPIQRTEYQAPIQFPVQVSSDSNSSVNTGGSTTTPNNSSDASSESAEPSVPSSPDNNTNQTPSRPAEINEAINTSMGVLSLNEGSTATNTTLSVTLPTNVSPNTNATASATPQPNNEQNQEGTSNTDHSHLEAPCSSRSGPESILNFGKGLAAVLSQGKEPYVSRHREHYREKEKRHSLTPSTHLQGNHSVQHRHSAEIVATSLLDTTPHEPRERSSRRRPERSSERSSDRSLPAPYLALYAYKPQKPDELELKKGAIYTVTERCRDGWYKGWAERTQRAGVFPGNYVTPHADKSSPRAGPVAPPAPDAPPRADSPPHVQPLSYPWSSQPHSLQSTPRLEKSKEKSKPDKSGVSLMKRLAAMKKCKSPPPSYSLDNPVFEDCPSSASNALVLRLPAHQPVHVRSGSCPSQLLRALPSVAGTGGPSGPTVGTVATPSDRRHKERPHMTHLAHRSNNDGPWQSQHRKSQSLDVTVARKDRHHSQTVKERFRCIVPYPPNSEYELELKVDDIVIVSKKRGDGWYKGTLQRTGRTGLFPASFVQSCPIE